MRSSATRASLLGLVALLPLLAEEHAVPFVGCPSDGQAGPVEAPTGQPKKFPITVDQAHQLAYYESGVTFGVLGPRGWHCFGLYGSSGGSLLVSPEPIDAATGAMHLSGPAIQILARNGFGSGMYEVARIIARVFPAYRHIPRALIEGDGMDPKLIPFGPYRGDKLKYKSDQVVEYVTPAHTDGLGTSEAYFQIGATETSGVAMLVRRPGTAIGDCPDLIFLAVRLPEELQSLGSVIVQQSQSEALRIH